MEEFAAHKCGKNKSFKCTVCNKNFARQTLLRQHMVLHQGSKRFRFKCNYCGRAFRHRSHLRDHERIHTGTYGKEGGREAGKEEEGWIDKASKSGRWKREKGKVVEGGEIE